MPKPNGNKLTSGTPGLGTRLYQGAVNQMTHGRWETEADYYARIQSQAPNFMGSGFHRFEAAIKAKLFRVKPPVASTAPAAPLPGGGAALAGKASARAAVGKEPASEHRSLLGDHTNGRIWIASNALPGDDVDTFVDDGRGGYLGQCVSLEKNVASDSVRPLASE